MFSQIGIFVLFVNISTASQTIDFSNQNVARSILLNKTWDCKMIDSLGEGQGYWTFNSVIGMKVKGEIEIPQYIACSSDTLRGTIRRNTLKYTSRSTHSSCVSVNGVFTFTYNESGQLIAKGVYIYGGTRRRGVYTCEQLNIVK